MKKRIYRIVKEKCGIPQVGARWTMVVTLIAATLMVGVALAQRRPARFEPRQRDEMAVAERQERQALAERRDDLENRARELRARLDEVRAELAELEQSDRAESDQAHALRGELRDLENKINEIERIEREFRRVERNWRDRDMRPMQDRAPRQEILRRLEELGHETEMVLQRLVEQNFDRNDETNMLYGRMRELNQQMKEIRQQLGRQLKGTGRQEPEFDVEQMRDGFVREFRRQEPSEEKIIQMEELRERARRIELELKELGGENPERAEKLHAELREIHEAISQIERDVSESRERGATRQMRQRELQEHAHELERRLQELGDNHPEEAQELRMQLDQIHGQMERIEREPGIHDRPWPRVENPVQPGREHREQLLTRREQLRTRLGELELVLGELNGQGKADSEEAQMRRLRLSELQEQLQATENKLREREPDRAREPGRDDLEREVQDLRKQMDNVNEQMGEMRELMKRLLEQRESPEASQ